MTPATSFPSTHQHEIQRIEDLTRREFISSAFAAALLIACGDDDDGPATGATRTITTPHGEIQVPVAPKRVVSVNSRGTTDVLDDLGTPLVGIQYRNSGSVWSGLSEETRELPSIGNRPEVDFEKIVSLAPDLIVGNIGDNAEMYERLVQIAPTILHDDAQGWRETVNYLADLIGKQEEASRLLAQVDQRLLELNIAVGKRWPDGLKVSLLRMFANDGTVALVNTSNASSTGGTGVAGQVLRLVRGVTVSGDGLPPDASAFSPERLRDVDADVIIYFAGGGGAEGRADTAFAAATANPLWQTLEAVREGRAYRVDSYVWFEGLGVTAANLALDDMFEFLT